MVMKVKEKHRARKKIPVQPIRDPENIRRIRENLKDKTRDLLLFDLATLTGLKMKEILKLRVRDLRALKTGGKLIIADNQGKSSHGAKMRETIRNTLELYLNERNQSDDDYLFKSRKGSKPLNIATVSRLTKAWFSDAGLSGLNGARSLRKTWALHYAKQPRIEKVPAKILDSEHVLQPIELETLQRRVYQAIYVAITSGEYPPGTRLITEKIADQLNVSQMPVREAFHRLEARGFVISLKKRGYLVNALTKENLKEITKIRIALETMAAEMASLSRSEESLKRLKTIHAQYEKAIKQNNVKEHLSLNRQFHLTLYRAANMPILQRVIENLWNKISPYLHILCQDRKFDSAPFLRNHEEMLSGIERRDSLHVIKWVKIEIIEGQKLILDIIERF